ncbi:MAG TPA: 50S ribosomal protein L13 [Planctomycetota bacterium]|nr:50S ribosomal protein L13 [Planctomycetota bacterium]
MKTTYLAKPGHDIAKWRLVDASDRVLGRMASKVAMMLMGKHRAQYTPHVDTGDFVVVVNAERVKLTGKKAASKVYRHHTGHIGGLVERPFKEMIVEKPEEVVELAVRRMLPKTKLGRRMFSKLKVYRGGQHPHAAQKPEPTAV